MGVGVAAGGVGVGSMGVGMNTRVGVGTRVTGRVVAVGTGDGSSDGVSVSRRQPKDTPTRITNAADNASLLNGPPPIVSSRRAKGDG